MDNTQSKTLIAKNLTATFTDNCKHLKVLKNVNFSVKEKQFVSIIGPSGCGKSTLFRLISGLPTKDTCEIEGEIRIGKMKPKTACRNREIGLILQKPTLLEWRTVESNMQLPLEIIGYGENKRKEIIKKLLKLLDLTEYAQYRPTELSGGMQQKVSIGRALAYDPNLLLMDEPFGALDEINRRKMDIEILDIWKKTNKTILFITHSIEEAVFLSQKIIVLTKKPSTVHKIINIDLPYPREKVVDTSKYFKYITETRNTLNEATK
jgi:NitT/TauT family transport system ATP-binding protein